MNVLALPGSLRAASINAALCRAAVRLAPSDLRVTVSDAVGSLPLYNADLEAAPPQTVVRFRQAIGGADALLIASPEYAHGISGVMKNALDWLVGYEGFVGKPVAVINSSPRARHAQESLLEVLKTMSAAIAHQACVTVPLLGSCITEHDMVGARAIALEIRSALTALGEFVSQGSRRDPAFPVGQ
jgi:NAD(P)H-dependent FMN reductase